MTPKNYLLNTLAIGIALLLPHSGLIPIPMAYSIPILLLVWFFLKHFKEDFSDIGFRLKALSLKPILIGCLFAILFVTFSQFILYPVLEALIDFDNVDVELYNKLKGKTSFYIFILVMGWLIGGLYEEIVFHGFIFTRLEKMIPGKYATLLGFLCTAIFFGAYHIQLGGADAINAFFAGGLYHALSLYYKRDLWYGIFCHGAYNSIVITLLYLGYL